MKRAGFTMIELIFVIVILGILAAVAVPKLAATRDDAKVAKGATELATAIGDIGTYYTAKGGMASSLSTMTNVSFSDNTADMNDTTITAPTYEGCISLTPTSTSGGAADGIMITYTGTTNGSPSAICQGIAKAAVGITGTTDVATDSNKTHNFGGVGVTW